MPWIKTEMEWFLDEETYSRLKSGELERVGGIIRDAESKQIVKWLKLGKKQPERKPVHPFFRVIAHSTDLELLSDEELVEFARFINESSSLSKPKFYSGSKSAVSAILGKYDRLQGEKALEYGGQKRESLLNIFGRTYIPNLRMQVELGYITLSIDDEKEIAELTA